MKVILRFYYIYISVDTPDPFVSLYIKTAPNCFQKTTTKDNDVNPVWNEAFKFYIDPREKNELGK